MKKLLTALMCATMVLGIAGCGSSSEKEKEPAKKEYIAEKDIKKAYSDPDKYKGLYIKMSGKVFSEPEKDDKGVYFQMWGDPEKNELNTIVGYGDPDMDIKSNDYVIVEGKIAGKYEGANAFGGAIDAIQISAESVKKVSYTEAFDPAIKTLTPSGLTNSQNSVDINITKIEFAKKETRIYYSVENKSGSAYSFYDFNMKAVQNGKQYEEQDNFNADYPSVSGDVLNGVKSEGIMSFPVLEQKDFTIHIDAGSSDNYDLEFTEINFDVVVK